MADKYTLMISEKPDAMKRIAEALSEGKSLKRRENEKSVSFYEFKKDGKKHVIVCAVGHLFNLDPADKGKGWNYPIFNAEWKPSFSVRKQSEFSKKYFEVIEQMAKNANDYIVCTDFDTEGSVIGFNILKFICGVEDGKRMKFSTLTKDELVDSYKNMSKHLDIGQIESGLARHQLDWLWGINLTRALTLALKNATKGFNILSSGRVQSPTLAILYEKEEEIRKFKSIPFWELQLHVKIDGMEAIAKHEKGKLWDKEEADKTLQECEGKDVKVKEIKKRQYKQSPPVPFNTTDLLSEAYAIFKFSPTQTMSIAESLYQAGYISYPRSSSQKLPPSINYGKILKSLATLPQYKKFARQLLKKEKLIPNEGTREDPAHPAIYATWEVPDLKKLNIYQKKIYDLIVRRTLAAFADEATRESNTVSLDLDGHVFVLVGKRTIEPGWTEIYEPYLTIDELILPELKVGQNVKVLKLEELAKETEPPGRYSQGSVLKELESRNLGTKATRAEILQTLYDRKYIVGKSIQVTKLGEAVVKSLKEYSPRIISEDLTKKFEEEMEQVFNGKKKREDVVEEAKETLTDILKEFKENEQKIGKKLLEGLVEAREQESHIGACPNCNDGKLKILRSRLSGKFFVGCSSYFKCAKCGFTRAACKCICEKCGQPKGKCKCSWNDKKWEPSCQTTYPLPGRANIQPTGKICDKCNTPIIQVWRKGRRPFRMCLSTTCETKKDWGKRKSKKVKLLMAKK